MVQCEVQKYGAFEGKDGEVQKPKAAGKWRLNIIQLFFF